jgi:methylsterol monooxygenase
MAFTNNFSTSFRWWDRIFGTDVKYREYRARVNAMVTKMGGACTKEQQAAIEHKLLERWRLRVCGLRAAAEAEGETTTGKTVKVQ